MNPSNRYSLCSSEHTMLARDLPECDWRVTGFKPSNGKPVAEMKTGDVWGGQLGYEPGSPYERLTSYEFHYLHCLYKEPLEIK